MSGTARKGATRYVHAMPFGAALLPEGGVRFRLWAPTARPLQLRLVTAFGDERFDAPADADGWREVIVPRAAAGSRYQWIVPTEGGEIAVPDPASRSNPEGVHAPSAVVDPNAFAWDGGWRGRPWSEAVISELHIGTFTPEGTFAAAEKKLAQMADDGITCIELMPIASFPGRFGWGYDGVLHYAPHPSYGSPDELKHFVQAAHRLGLMVMLDVVYNHFGPDGNYLSLYAPGFFDPSRHTAWGAAIAFDGEHAGPVREYFIHNALYWLHEFQLDGLRFDAVHAIVDRSTPDILQEIAARARDHAQGRTVHLVLENEHNDPRRLDAAGDPGRFDAQWNDDFHHAIHVLLTGEDAGYYAPYAEAPLALLARCLTHGFVQDRTRHGQPARRADGTLPLARLVDFVHNHDQVGNRAFGERLIALVDEAPMRLAVALLLLGPSTPMLFMGDEHGARTPFLYFADWSGELRRAVTEGRRREFAHFPQFADEAVREQIPDPCDARTFERSKLDWPAFDREPQRRWNALYRELLALRRSELWPRLDRLAKGLHRSELHGVHGLAVQWAFEAGGHGASEVFEMVVNFGPGELRFPHAVDEASTIVFTLGEAADGRLGAWSGQWRWLQGERSVLALAEARAEAGASLDVVPAEEPDLADAVMPAEADRSAAEAPVKTTP